MDEHFTVWIKKACPFCVQTREELFEQNADHTIHIMDDKPDRLAIVKEKWGHPTVPIIVRSHTATDGPALLIGGYTDLKKYLDGKKND